MNRRPLLAALVLAALAAGSATVLRAGQEPVAADGLPAMSGTWNGKIALRTAGLDPSVAPLSLRGLARLEITQNGYLLNATLTIVGDPPTPDTVYDLHGQVGNGQFWLQGDTTGLGTPMQILGKVTDARGTLRTKASGIFTSGDSAGTLSLQVSRPGI